MQIENFDEWETRSSRNERDTFDETTLAVPTGQHTSLTRTARFSRLLNLARPLFSPRVPV